MFSKGPSGDFSWLANEISAIRNGVDKLSTVSAAQNEKILNVRDDVSKLVNRVDAIDSNIKSLETVNVAKSAAWSGPMKLGAFLVVLFSVIQGTISTGLIHISFFH